MLAKIAPSAAQCEHAKPGLLQIALHVGGEYAAPFARVKLPLNRVSVVASGRNNRTVRALVLQQHRNRCRPATLSRLLDERNVQPNPRLGNLLRPRANRRQAEQQKSQSKRPPAAS